MEVLKRKSFSKWQASQGLCDSVLCLAVREMEQGLIDARLGGMLYKKRVAMPGRGKRGGYRTMLSARTGKRYVFLCGFAKNELASLTLEEQNALRFSGRVFLDLPHEALFKALESGVLMEVFCEQAH